MCDASRSPVRSTGLVRNLLFTAFLVAGGGCGHRPGVVAAPSPTSLAQAADCSSDLAALAEAAARGDAGATAQLRAAGPPGLDAVLAAYDRTPPGDVDRRASLSAAIDAVARQKDARASRLYWYTDLEAAKQSARTSGRPILSLRMLGELDDDLSCANSRFFRTALYPDREVGRLLRERFVLHWSSERPAPVVTIDFRDGRTLKRTVTGNSLHYVLDSEGRVVDAIPGLWGPRAFARVVGRAGEVAREVTSLGDRARARRLASYHEKALDELRGEWGTVAAAVLPAPPPFPADLAAPPAAQRVASVASVASVAAIAAIEVAPAKAVVERPLVRAFIQPPPADLSAYAETVPWRAFVKVLAPACRLDASSLALIREKRPRSWSDASALGRPLTEPELGQLVAGFEAAMAEDTAKNAYLYHGVLHRWLLEAARRRSGADAFAALNTRIYAEAFRTPAADPWLGLVPPAAYSGLQDDGITTTPATRPALQRVATAPTQRAPR